MTTHEVEYWNGTKWRKMNHEYLGETSDNLIRMVLDRGFDCDCELVGRLICQCASTGGWYKESFSRPMGANIYSVHTPSQNLGGSQSAGWGQGFIQWSQNYGQTKIPLDDIVDELTLKGEYVFEASL